MPNRKRFLYIVLLGVLATAVALGLLWLAKLGGLRRINAIVFVPLLAGPMTVGYGLGGLATGGERHRWLAWLSAVIVGLPGFVAVVWVLDEVIGIGL